MSKTREMARWMLGIIFVLAIVIIGTAVFALVGGKGLQSITISPTTADTELDINQDYYINVSTDPAGENISKFKFEVDSTCVTFSSVDSSNAILHTLGEGQVTIFVTKGKIESNRLTFTVVDKAARQAEEEAKKAEEEAKKAEEEARLAEEEAIKAAEEAEVILAEVTGDSVNVRTDATTEAESLGKASKGDRFTKVEDKDGWTGVEYDGKTGYIRNDFVKVGTEEELGKASESDKKEDETKKDDKKEDETKKDDKKEDETKKDDKKEEVKNTDSDTKSTDEEAKKAEEAKKSEEAKKAEEEAAKKAQEDAAKQLAEQQAAAATSAPAASGSLPASGPWTYGGITFSASQVAYFHSLWDYTGDAAEMASHHPAGELQTLCQNSNVN